MSPLWAMGEVGAPLLASGLAQNPGWGALCLDGHCTAWPCVPGGELPPPQLVAGAPQCPGSRRHGLPTVGAERFRGPLWGPWKAGSGDLPLDVPLKFPEWGPLMCPLRDP